MHSPKRLARIAGFLYLLNGVTAGVAFGYVLSKVYVPGNAATTAGNVLANAGLVRMGVLLDLFQATEWAFLAMTLYLLLQHVHKSAATAMVVLVPIGSAVTCPKNSFTITRVPVTTDRAISAALT